MCSNSINVGFVDDAIEAALVTGLVNGAFADLLSPDVHAQAELVALRVERKRRTEKAADLERALGDAEGVLETSALTGALKKLDIELKQLTTQIQTIEATNPARELFDWVVAPDADPNTTVLSGLAVLAAWQDLEVSQQRSVVRALLEVRVLSGKGDFPGRRGKRGTGRVVVTKKFLPTKQGPGTDGGHLLRAS